MAKKDARVEYTLMFSDVRATHSFALAPCFFSRHLCLYDRNLKDNPLISSLEIPFESN